MENNSTVTQELKRKDKFSGKVIKTTIAGAVVDIGQKKLGVIHISQLSKEKIKRVEDVLNIGDPVEVWVRRINKDANHIELTLIQPLALEWREIKKGMVVKGEVVKTEKFGAFIEIGAERPGLAHISELAHDYIKTTDDAVKVGEQVEVKILDFNRRKKQIKLSLKALKEEIIEVEEPEVEVEATPALTAMEIAYRKAVADESGDYWEDFNKN